MKFKIRAPALTGLMFFLMFALFMFMGVATSGATEFMYKGVSAVFKSMDGDWGDVALSATKSQCGSCHDGTKINYVSAYADSGIGKSKITFKNHDPGSSDVTADDATLFTYLTPETSRAKASLKLTDKFSIGYTMLYGEPNLGFVPRRFGVFQI